MPPRQTLRAFALLASAWSLSGCDRSGKAREAAFDVIWPQTAEYARSVRAFPIAPEEARQIAAHLASQQQEIVANTPLFIWRGRYAFGIPEKEFVPIRGYFVNGTTGEVEFRDGTLTLSQPCWGNAKLFDSDWLVIRKITAEAEP